LFEKDDIGKQKTAHLKQGTAVATGTPDPDDFDFDPDEDEKFKWDKKNPKDADRISRHEKFGKFYRDPTQKLGNKDIWWTKDNAGHRDTVYKLYTVRNGQFRHFADVDKNGVQILKHKGNIGKNIPIKEFIGVK